MTSDIDVDRTPTLSMQRAMQLYKPNTMLNVSRSNIHGSSVGKPGQDPALLAPDLPALMTCGGTASCTNSRLTQKVQHLTRHVMTLLGEFPLVAFGVCIAQSLPHVAESQHAVRGRLWMCNARSGPISHIINYHSTIISWFVTFRCLLHLTIVEFLHRGM